MRRILKKIVVGSEDIGDISTLSDPTVVEDIIKKFKEKKIKLSAQN